MQIDRLSVRDAGRDQGNAVRAGSLVEASHKNAIAESLQGAIPATARAPTEALLFPLRSASFRRESPPLMNKSRVH